MRKVKDIASVPRGGEFVYFHERGSPQEFVQRHPYYVQLKSNVLKYKRDNNIPVGLAFDDQFDEEVCRNADSSTCEDFVPPSLLQKMSNLAQALYRAAKSGFKTVTPEQFEERRAICGACNFFVGSNGLLKITCNKCGCAGIKLAWQSEKCPISKW